MVKKKVVQDTSTDNPINENKPSKKNTVMLCNLKHDGVLYEKGSVVSDDILSCLFIEKGFAQLK